jgi:hypothetical protein
MLENDSDPYIGTFQMNGGRWCFMFTRFYENQIQANKTLPKGGLLLKKPINKKIGDWVEMEFDATFVYLGIMWLRVKNGFGDRGDRESWVADITDSSPHVSDYHFVKERYCGFKNYPSFESALRGEMKYALSNAREKLKEKKRLVNRIKSSIYQLEKALARKDT